MRTTAFSKAGSSLGGDLGMSEPRDSGLPPLFKQLLGSIVESWAYVDGAVNEMLALLMRADPGSVYVVTQNVSSSSVSTWVRTLLETMAATDGRNALLELLSEIDALRGERNAVVHGLWMVDGDPDSAILQTIKWDRREVVRHELMTCADLEDLWSRIKDARPQIDTALLRMGFKF